jgi:ankyrin repeat protein
VVRYLLDQGANVDATSPNGTTALMMAAREHHPDIGNLLLDRGADPNVRNGAGMTALRYAEAGNEDKVRSLAVRYSDRFHEELPVR